MRRLFNKSFSDKQAVLFLNAFERVLEKVDNDVYINLFNTGIVVDIKGTLLKTVRTAKGIINIKKKRNKKGGNNR